jgi:hypothetical protein
MSSTLGPLISNRQIYVFVNEAEALEPKRGEFEVLYTSLERDAALAEIGYRLSLEPIWPSRIGHELHLIQVQTERTLKFDSLLVPSARFDCANLVIFSERVTGLILRDSQPVDWESWRRRRVRR